MVLEFSLILPVLLMLTLGTVILSLGVSQFQQVASLAREGSRYASVRGTEYQSATGNKAATAADVYNNAIFPLAVGMPSADLGYQVTWAPDNKPGSTVTVTVTYTWVPSAYVGTINMSSTSVMTVAY